MAHSGPKMAPSEPQGRPKWLQRETNIAKVVLALALDSAEEDQGGPKRATSIPTDATRAPEEDANVVLPAVPIDAKRAY